ncbi:acetolactate synthase [Pseudoxanthomonas kalamensis DSM 18571]|uniref:ACT domain-containing protein n=1 Tax=Pseudoxanthomonas kalamensis TaxID=289483 RepID=UPI0013911280|nr:ACT domain-containing protein [Pseudoxanthomonas kalamensis]KAF1712065.1 acetolactate synthase [Pseudoxanthomonas kalamensis DSM 18571]
MQYRLDLVLKPAEGALVRTLGLIERRGFAPRAINGAPDPADGRWRVQLVVDSARPVEGLRLQLLKLYDCEAVEATALPRQEQAA